MVRTVLFLLLPLLCPAAAAQQFVIEHRFLIESTASTASTPAADTSSKSAADLPAPSSAAGWYVAVFTSRTCEPCKRLKERTIPELRRAGINVRVIDIDSDEYDNVWNVSRVPEIRIIDLQTRKLRRKHIGFVSASMLLAAEKPAPEKPEKPASQISSSHIFNGEKGSSHENRESLIEHLLTEGIHAGRHTFSELTAMTDQQLSDLHDEEHDQHEKRTGQSSPKPPQWVRPGTVQMQSRGRMRVRGGFFGIFR